MSRIVLLLTTLVVLINSDARSQSFPFSLEAQPIVEPGPAGSWDAGSVAAPRVFEADGRLLMFYVGAALEGVFDNPIAIGAAESFDGLTWEKVAENPVITPEMLDIRATGIEAVGILSVDGSQVRVATTPVGSQRQPLSHHEVSLDVGTWLATTTFLADAQLAPETWNGRFYGLETAYEKDGGTYFLSSGCCGANRWHIGEIRISSSQIVWTNDPATNSLAFQVSDPVFAPSLRDAAWDRDDVFGPAVTMVGKQWVMLYAAAPGSGAPDTMHTVGYAVSDDLITWNRPEGEGRLLQPAPGHIIEGPYLHGGVLYVDKKPFPNGKRAIFRAEGSFPIDLEAPRKLKVRILSDTEARLKWKFRSKKSDADALEIEMRREGKKRFKLVAVVPTKRRKIVLEGLEPGRTYIFRLRATGPSGPSAYSNEKTATTPAPEPEDVRFEPVRAGR